LFHPAGHRPGEAQALNAIGWMQTQLGQHEQAVACYRNALVLFEYLGSRHHPDAEVLRARLREPMWYRRGT
jgi:hypothetical protein